MASENTWQADEEITLIEFYAQRPYIWDPKNPQYSKTNLKTCELEKLVPFLSNKYTVPEIKRKWEKLRTVFNRNWAKWLATNKSGAGSADIFKPSYRHFSKMSFLKDSANMFIDGVSTMSQPPNNSQQQQTAKEHPGENVEAQGDYCQYEFLQEEGLDEIVEAQPPPKTPQVKKKRIESLRDEIAKEAIKALQASQQALTTPKRDAVDDDEQDLFGRLVAKKLRSFNPDVAEDIQQQILSLFVAYKDHRIN